jgi:hypothetical protein
MRRVLLGALFVSCWFVAACTRYYDPPEGWEGAYTATEVLNKALAAAGSKIDPMEGAEDLTVDATIRVQQDGEPIAANYVLRWKRPDKYSIEVTSGPLAGRRIVCDGERAAEFTGATLSRPQIPREETGIAQFMNRLFVLHFFRTGQGGVAEMKENTTSAKGEPWIHLYKPDQRNRPHYLMLDAKSLEPRLLRTYVPYQDGTDRAIDTLFENFATDPRAGRIPMVWKSYEGNKLREELRIGSLRWNQRLDDAAFAIP